MINRKAFSIAKTALLILIVIVIVGAGVYLAGITRSAPTAPISTATQSSLISSAIQTSMTSTTQPLMTSSNPLNVTGYGGQTVIPSHAPVTGKLQWYDTPLPGPSVETFNDVDNVSGPSTYVTGTNVASPSTPPTTIVNQNRTGDPPLTGQSSGGDPPTVFGDLAVPCTGSCGFPGSYIEPAVANNGQNIIFYTATYLGGASTDGGKTWKFTGQDAQGNFRDLNGDLQCGCDQDVVYAPQISEFVWYRQGSGAPEPNSITLVDGNDPINGLSCSITIYPSTLNSAWGSSYWMDFPVLTLGEGYVYLTINNFNNNAGPSVGSLIVRFNLNSLKSACFNGASQTVNYYVGPYGSIGAVFDGANTVYWASHISDVDLRVFSWAESSPDSSSVQSNDISISRYPVPSNENCKSPDGGNPCGRVSDTAISGWYSDYPGYSDLTFIWGAGADASSGYPFPWIDMVNIDAHSMQEKSEAQIFNSNYAIIYAYGAVNSLGSFGNSAIVFWMTGGGAYPYPTPGIVFPDESVSNITPLDQGGGSGGASANRWGDYLRVRPYIPGPDAVVGWVATAYIYPPNGGHIQPYYYVFSTNQDMAFSVSVKPNSSSVNAGYIASAAVTVTSLNGIQTDPITLRVAGLTQGIITVGTEDLTGKTCTFQPLQIGSTCNFTLDITTPATAPTGTYELTIWAQSSAHPGKYSANAGYALTIGQSVAPSPVIVTPINGATFTLGQAVPLIGYARLSQAQLIPWASCSSLTFQASVPSVAPETPTQDSSYQGTGYCDASMTFNAPGQVVITLTAANAAGVTGTAQVTINVVTQQTTTPFGFSITPAQTETRVAQGNSVTMTVTVNFISGTPQPVQLSVSGLPNGVTASFSSNSVTPTATVTLTIMAAYNTQAGQTYTLTISGSGGGTTNTATLLLYVDYAAG